MLFASVIFDYGGLS